MNAPVAVNLITGPLGSGKTTLIKNLIQQKPQNERWTILVNEFGAVGIDGAILAEHGNVNSIQLPGGCICCTAKTELNAAIRDILEDTPDRLLIEPTGLGEPDTIVDLLRGFESDQQITIETLFTVLDSADTDLQSLKIYTFMQNLINMADIILLNKKDLARPVELDSLRAYCRELYPPKQAIIATRNSQIDARTISYKHPMPAHDNLDQAANTPHHFSGAHSHAAPPISEVIHFAAPAERLTKEAGEILSIGYQFNNEVTFDWKALFALFKTLAEQPGLSELKRAKGVFKVGKPRMLFQWSNHQASREYIAYRRDSRIELLLSIPDPSGTNEPPLLNLTAFEKQLNAAITHPSN